MPLIELTNLDDARLRVFSSMTDSEQQAVKCPTRVYSLPNRAT